MACFFRRAFTVIELLIVLVIIVCIAKLLMPRYFSYQDKTREAEVMVNLTALYAAQQVYHAEHGQYTNNLRDLGWQPKGYSSSAKTTQHSCTYGSATGTEGVHFFTGSTQTAASELGNTPVTPQHFILKAGCKTDTGLRIWSINEKGNITKH